MESQEQAVEGKKKKVRMRNPRSLMMECINELTKMSKDESIRGPKRIDALLQKSALVTEAARLQAADAESEALAENVTLKASLEEATANIAGLESRTREAERKVSERLVEIVPDTRVPAFLKQISDLQQQLLNFAQAVREELDADQKALIVMNVAAVNFEAAKLLMKSFGLEQSDVYAVMQASIESLQSALATNPHNQFSPLYRAELRVRGIQHKTVRRESRSETYCPDFAEEF